MDAVKEEVDQLERLEDRNLVVDVGLLEEDKDERVQQLLVGEHAGCSLLEGWRVTGQ